MGALPRRLGQADLPAVDRVTGQHVVPTTRRYGERRLLPPAAESQHQAGHHRHHPFAPGEGHHMCGFGTMGSEGPVGSLRSEEMRAVAAQGERLPDHPHFGEALVHPVPHPAAERRSSSARSRRRSA